jgi:hypothetical protein
MNWWMVKRYSIELVVSLVLVIKLKIKISGEDN